MSSFVTNLLILVVPAATMVLVLWFLLLRTPAEASGSVTRTVAEPSAPRVVRAEVAPLADVALSGARSGARAFAPTSAASRPRITDGEVAARLRRADATIAELRDRLSRAEAEVAQREALLERAAADLAGAHHVVTVGDDLDDESDRSLDLRHAEAAAAEQANERIALQAKIAELETELEAERARTADLQTAIDARVAVGAAEVHADVTTTSSGGAQSGRVAYEIAAGGVPSADALVPLLGEVGVALQRSISDRDERIARLERDAAEFAAAEQELVATRAGHQAEVDRLTAELSGLRSELGGARSRSESELAEVRGRADRSESELAEVRGRAESLQAELADVRGRAESVQAELAEARAEVARLEAERDDVRAEMTRRLDAAQDETARLGTELETASGEQQRLADELLSATAQLEQLEADRSHLADRVGLLRGRDASMLAEVSEARRRISAIELQLESADDASQIEAD